MPGRLGRSYDFGGSGLAAPTVVGEIAVQPPGGGVPLLLVGLIAAPRDEQNGYYAARRDFGGSVVYEAIALPAAEAIEPADAEDGAGADGEH